MHGPTSLCRAIRANHLKFAISKSQSREKFCTHPLPPIFGLKKGTFQGRRVGVYILRPHAAGILDPPPPLIIHPPTPRRVFSGVGGVGVYKMWPHT